MEPAGISDPAAAALSAAPSQPVSTRAGSPRQPLVGVAICAVAGVAVADWYPAEGSPWLFSALFAAVAAVWFWRRSLVLCWLLIALGFGTLHVFRQNAVPAAAFARLLDPTGDTPPRQVRAVGRVLDEPRVRPGSANARFNFALESVELDGDGIPRPTHARVVVSWPLNLPPELPDDTRPPPSSSSPRNPPVAYPPLPVMGDHLALAASARNLRGARNPGETDYAAQALRNGIRSELRLQVDPLHPLRTLAESRGISPIFVRAAGRLREWMRERLHHDLRDDPEVAAIVSSMILGIDADMEKGALGDALQVTGTLHFFAIDGLKIGLLAAIGITILRTGMRRELAGLLVVPALGFYALATGLGPASLRATLIAAVLLGGLFFDRPTRAMNNLGAAAVLLLFFDTNQLFSRGFQLSFAVVLVILLVARPIDRKLRGLGAPDPFLPRVLLPRWRVWLDKARRWAVGVVSVSLAAWLGSLPLMIWYFHFVSPMSALANILVFPFALAVLGLCLCALAGGFWNLWVGWMNNANWLFAKVLIGIVKACALLPGGYVYVGDPREWQLSGTRPAVELLALDLGRKSSATHLRTRDGGRHEWLVDTGRAFDYERAVRPALHARGVNALTGLLLRQGDAAHLGAAPLALAEFGPGRGLAPAYPSPRSMAWKDWQTALGIVRDRRLSRDGASRGDEFDLSPALRARVLYPPVGLSRPPVLADDRALVVQLIDTKTGRARALLTADSGETTERWLLANESAQNLRSDVLVLGAHHGGISGTTDFLRAVGARLIVCPFLADQPQLPPEQTPSAHIFCLEKSGATRVRFFRDDRIEASGFVDGKRAIVNR